MNCSKKDAGLFLFNSHHFLEIYQPVVVNGVVSFMLKGHVL